MSTTPTTITFSLKMPTGGPVMGGKATFVLSSIDFDGGIVLPGSVEADIRSDGTGSVALWPNISGLRNTSYKVTITATNGTKVEAGNIVVPETTAAVALHTLLPIGTVAGLTALVLTQAEYDMLDPKREDTLYLIRAAA